MNQETHFALADNKVNHILHLIVTLVTAGLWLIPWLIISAHSCSKRNDIRKAANMSTEFNWAGIIITVPIIVVVFVAFGMSV